MEDYAMNESIEFLLRAVNRRAEKLANQELAKFDLTSTQFRTLMYLSHQPPLTVRQCDLEVFFSKSNPAVTGILNNMEQKDLIRRVCNPADGRSKVLEITDKIVTENHLTTLMITHNMRDAINYGNRLIMMYDGHIVVDVSGEEKKNLTVEQLLALFSQASGSDEVNDKLILG